MTLVDSFDCLSLGDYVRWNEELRYCWSSLPNAESWRDEPWDCVFSVVFLAKDGDDEQCGFELECVRDCGCHEVTLMSAAAYDRACRVAGTPLLKLSGFYDLGEFLLDAKPEYDFDRATADIFDLIDGGRLPKTRRQ